MHDCRYWLWLSEKFEPGSVRYDKLLQAFDYNPKAIYEADRAEYERLMPSNLRAVNALCDKSLDFVYKTLEFCEKKNVGILTMDDSRYPSAFFCIDGQPPVIYYKGTIPDFETRFTISIVGTRNVTPYGSDGAYTFANDIASCGGIVVSGMALGADTAAHRGALDAKGTTVAFLGCGIDVVYPKENAYMMEEIIASGAVMTDYPPHSRPEGRHFPVRNRLISGISHGVLIVEAGRKSGALITAEHALRQGKLLYAIPGRIGELNSEGSNNLLVKGAKTVAGAADIINDYRHLFHLEEKVNMSGFKRFRTSMPPERDLNRPYKTPTYNPFAFNSTSYTDKNGGGSMYDSFMQYTPAEVQPKDTEQPAKMPSSPMYIDLNVEQRNQGSGQAFGIPKPRIIFRDFDDEEHKRAMQSMSEAEKAEIDRLHALGKAPTIIYPEGPMPKGGYRVNLTPEKRAFYNNMSSSLSSRNLDIRDADTIKPVIDCVTDVKDLGKVLDNSAAFHEEQLRRREAARKSGIPDYSGLTEPEISILKLLKSKGTVTANEMSHLGIPINKLLSVLTVLEMKKRIKQLPGGYFELNEKY